MPKMAQINWFLLEIIRLRHCLRSLSPWGLIVIQMRAVNVFISFKICDNLNFTLAYERYITFIRDISWWHNLTLEYNDRKNWSDLWPSHDRAQVQAKAPRATPAGEVYYEDAGGKILYFASEGGVHQYHQSSSHWLEYPARTPLEIYQTC